MDITKTLTGTVPGILIAAAILTAPVALLLISLYRRAVIRLMSNSAQSVPAESAPPQKSKLYPSSLTTKPEFVPLGEASAAKNEATMALYGKLRKRHWQAAAIYSLGGLCFAIVMAIGMLLAANAEISPMKLLTFILIFLWPSIPVINIVASPSLRVSTIVTLSYFLLYIALSAINIARSPLLDWKQVVMLWAIYNVASTLLVLTFLYRKIRAVGPLIFTLLTFGFTGIVFLSIYGGKALVDRAVAEPGLARLIVGGLLELGVSSYVLLILFIILGFLLMAACGWALLQLLKWLYLHKRQSDQSLVVDPIWLMFGYVTSAFLASQNPWWILAGFIALAFYKLVTWTGFYFLNRKRRLVKGPKLLLLRVFSLGKRSEQLYSAIARAWRYVGNIRFITGPDLATSTVEPHNFLDYISGRLRYHFIDSAETLKRRIENADVLPDLDGRYRVHDFFCYDDTWKMVLSRLAKDSDAILMDLRKFSQTNAGCVFEINELVNYVPLKRVVFVLDKTTDEAFLHESIENAWKGLSVDSPNREECPKIYIDHYDETRPGDLHQLLYALSVAATSS